MPLSFSQKVNLSSDARYLLGRAQAGRDRVVLGVVSAGTLGLMASHGFVNDVSLLSVGASVVSMVGAGFVAAKSYMSMRELDQKVIELASYTEQAAPLIQGHRLLAIGDVERVVQKADIVVPDMLKGVANRRARIWDEALSPNYRPPAKRQP